MDRFMQVIWPSTWRCLLTGDEVSIVADLESPETIEICEFLLEKAKQFQNGAFTPLGDGL